MLNKLKNLKNIFKLNVSKSFLSLNINNDNEILTDKIKEVIQKEKDCKIQSLEISETFCGTTRCYNITVKRFGSDIIKSYYVEKTKR